MASLARGEEELAVPFRDGVFNILHSSIRCSGESERGNVRTAEIIWSEQKQQSRSFAPSSLPSFRPRAMTRPFFPLSLSAALIADRSSVQGRRPPARVRRASESVDRTCFERSALDDAGNDGAGREGGREGRHHFCAAQASHSSRGGLIPFR